MKSTGLTTRCFSPVQRKPAKADFFCFRGKRRQNFPGGGGLFLAVRQQNAAPVFGRKRRGFFGTPPQVERLRFFWRAHSGAASAWGLLRVLRKQKKSAERLIFFFVVYFFNAAKGFGLYSPVEGMNPVRL